MAIARKIRQFVRRKSNVADLASNNPLTVLGSLGTTGTCADIEMNYFNVVRRESE